MWRTTVASSRPKRAVAHRLVERRVAHAGADPQLVAIDLDGRKLLNPVDVDEVRRLRQPERHDRDEALPARQHAAVLRRDLRQHRDRLGERLRCVIAEGSGFHSVVLSGPSGAREGPGRNEPRLYVPFQLWDFYYFLDSGTLLRLCKV